MRNFSTYPTAPLQNSSVLGVQTIITPRGNARAMPILFPWGSYQSAIGGAPSQFGVTGDLTSGAINGVGNPLASIAGVAIDNTGNPFPVYVVFKDTNQIIPCQGFATVSVAAITGTFAFSVYCFGAPAATAGITQVTFFDKLVPEILLPEIQQIQPQGISSAATPSFGGSGGQSFYSYALGDTFFAGSQIGAGTIELSASGGNSILIVTSASLTISNLPAGANFPVQFEIAGSVTDLTVRTTAAPTSAYDTIFNLSNCQIQTLQVFASNGAGAPAAAVLTMAVAYTETVTG